MFKKASISVLVLASTFACIQPAASADSLAATLSGLTASDVGFLTGQCQVDPRDVDVIGKLASDVQESLRSKIAQRQCSLLKVFIDSRNYFRRLDIKKPVPLPPAGWYGEAMSDGEGMHYLTKEERAQYNDIMNNAPW